MIRQIIMCGDSPLSSIMWKSEVVALVRMDREAQERIRSKFIQN